MWPCSHSCTQASGWVQALLDLAQRETLVVDRTRRKQGPRVRGSAVYSSFGQEELREPCVSRTQARVSLLTCLPWCLCGGGKPHRTQSEDSGADMANMPLQDSWTLHYSERSNARARAQAFEEQVSGGVKQSHLAVTLAPRSHPLSLPGQTVTHSAWLSTPTCVCPCYVPSCGARHLQ